MSESNGSAPPPEAQGPKIVHGMAPFDQGNTLLAVVPCSLTVTPQQTPLGQRLCVTVRSADVTLTLFLARDELGQWIDVLTQGKGMLTGLILPG